MKSYGTSLSIVALMILISMMMFAGCKTLKPVNPCAKCPRIWTGKAGDNPAANNEVWKCYNWVIKDQALEK